MACLFKINTTQRSIEPWNISIKWLLANATKGHKILSGKRGRETCVAHSCCQSSVCHCCCLCSHSGMIYQLLEDTWYRHTIRTSRGKINWMQWWLQFIILKKMAQKVREGWYIDHSSDKLLFMKQPLAPTKAMPVSLWKRQLLFLVYEMERTHTVCIVKKTH